MKRRHLLLPLGCAAAAAGLGGCSTARSLGLLPNNPVRRLQVVTELGANRNSATAIDLVWVFDPEADVLLPRNGPQWFAGKDALLAALGARVAVVSLELPPGQALPEVQPPPRAARAIAVWGFVNFLEPGGQAALSLTALPCTRLVLSATRVSAGACS